MSIWDICIWMLLGVVGMGLVGAIDVGLAAAIWVDALLDDIIEG